MRYYIRSTVRSTGEVKQPGMRFDTRDELNEAFDGLFESLINRRTKEGKELPYRSETIIIDPSMDMRHQTGMEGR